MLTDNRKLAPIAILIALGCPEVYSETVYVCDGEGEGGSTLYSEKPCKTTEGVKLHFPDSYSVGEGLSDLEKRNLSAIKAREQKEIMEKSEPVPKEEETPMAKSTPFDQAACDKAKADLKQWEKVISLGYLPEEKEYYIGELQKRTKNRDDACGLTGK